MKTYKYFLLALIIILIDQTSKLLVHKHMLLHDEMNILTYGPADQYGFKLHYLLNEGMAFGYRLENKFGKFILTIFRILAMTGIGYYLWKMVKKNMHPGFLWCMGLILGGAIGNVIDSTFYGVYLHNQPLDAPTPWFHGQVIDMLHFPLFRFTWPEWIPFMGGGDFLFFSPVFNIADSSIFIGVLIILLSQKKFFKDEKKDVDNGANQEAVAHSEQSEEPSSLPASESQPAHEEESTGQSGQ